MRVRTIAALTCVALLGAVVFESRQLSMDVAGLASGALPPGAVGTSNADPEWLAGLATRFRDPSGNAGSAVRSIKHDGLSATPGSQESRIFRPGYIAREPTLGITSNGWIFYVAYHPEDIYSLSVVLRSKDGGAQWEMVSDPETNEDPYLWVDRATDRVFFVNWYGCGTISYSDDLGETWTKVPPVGCGTTSDHQTLFAGPPVTSQTVGYPNIVYYCAIGGGASSLGSTTTVCLKSLDGAQSFVPTQTPPFPESSSADSYLGTPGMCGGASGHIFVGADGALYVPRGVCDQPWLAISRDEGDTWTRVQVAGSGMGRDLNGRWDHEAAVRADAKGTIYYSWVARDRIPYLVVSRDGGISWSVPVRVAPPDVREANLPNMDMDKAGRLAFIYMGSTNSPGAPFPNDGTCTAERQLLYQYDCGINQTAVAYEHVTWNGYITVTANPLDPNPVFETASINDPNDPLIKGQCGPFRCQAEYDFLDVEFGPDGRVYASVVDGCDPEGNCSAPGEAVLGSMRPSATVGQPQPLLVGSGSTSPFAMLALISLSLIRRRYASSPADPDIARLFARRPELTTQMEST